MTQLGRLKLLRGKKMTQLGRLTLLHGKQMTQLGRPTLSRAKRTFPHTLVNSGLPPPSVTERGNEHGELLAPFATVFGSRPKAPKL